MNVSCSQKVNWWTSCKINSHYRLENSLNFLLFSIVVIYPASLAVNEIQSPNILTRISKEMKLFLFHQVLTTIPDDVEVLRAFWGNFLKYQISDKNWKILSISQHHRGSSEIELCLLYNSQEGSINGEWKQKMSSQFNFSVPV